MSWTIKTELTHRCEVVHLFLSLKTCYWEWAEAFSDAVWSHNSNISFYPLKSGNLKLCGTFWFGGRGRGRTEDYKLQSFFSPSFFCSTTNQTRGGCAPSKLPLVKARDETGRKSVLLLRARLQWDFKVCWLNAFIWKGSLRKAATWLGTAMAVK